MGKSYDEIIRGLKGIVLDRYIIFYQLKSEELEIVRVVSGYRNLEAVFIDSED
jgi:toxin ParE1/3/4